MKGSTLIWLLLGGGAFYLLYKKFAAGKGLPPAAQPGQPVIGSRVSAQGAKLAQPSLLDNLLKGVKAAQGIGGLIFGGGGGGGGSASGKASGLADLFKGSGSGSTKPTGAVATKSSDEGIDLLFSTYDKSTPGAGLTTLAWNNEVTDVFNDNEFAGTPSIASGTYDFASPSSASPSYAPAPVFAPTVPDYSFSPSSPSQTFNYNGPVYAGPDQSALNYSLNLDAQSNAQTSSQFNSSLNYYNSFSDVGSSSFGVGGGYDFNPDSSPFDNFA